MFIGACHFPPEYLCVMQTQWKKANPYAKFPQLAPPGFDQLKDDLYCLLEGMESFGTMATALSSFCEVILSLLLKLLQFGCFHTNGVADLPVMSRTLDVLLDILDTEGESVFNLNETTKHVFNAKLFVCKICEFMFDCRVERSAAAASHDL